MRVDVIDNFPALARVKQDWDRVYDADPEAQVFLSWTWLSSWLEMLKSPWLILAAKSSADESHYVGFLPLMLRTKERKGGGFLNELNMAANYVADYTGFICAPEFQNETIRAFTKHIRRLNWTTLHLENFAASDDRRRMFLEHFSRRKFNTTEIERINKGETTDNCICPYVSLPSDWETYLDTRLSTSMRQKVRRFLRQVDQSSELRITHSGRDTIERDLKILLRFWSLKWGPRKGDRLPNMLRNTFSLLMRCFEREMLFLPVLWRGDTPLGALASLIDTRKKALLFSIGGRDDGIKTPPPGLVLHAHNIRFAIDNGFKTYDFLRGNEPYKYMFGADERRIKCISISTRNKQNLGNRLDKRSLPIVVRRTIAHHQGGRLQEAERGYRQILDIEPGNVTALYGFGQVLATKGHHEAAIKSFTALLAVSPDSQKTWLRLAKSLEAERRFSKAVHAYHEIIKRQPTSADDYHTRGVALFSLGQVEEAISTFEAALRLWPNYDKAQASLAKVRAAKAKSVAHLMNPGLEIMPKKNGGIPLS